MAEASRADDDDHQRALSGQRQVLFSHDSRFASNSSSNFNPRGLVAAQINDQRPFPAFRPSRVSDLFARTDS